MFDTESYGPTRFFLAGKEMPNNPLPNPDPRLEPQPRRWKSWGFQEGIPAMLGGE